MSDASYENYLSSGFCKSPTEQDPRRGMAELVLYNPTPEPSQATMTVYFADREPQTIPPLEVKPETNALVVMPRLAPTVFTNCGFWGARVLSTTPLILNFINAIRIMDDQRPRFRGGTTNFHGTSLHREWHFPDGLRLDRTKHYDGDTSGAPSPFNEFEYYYLLNPNPRDTQVEMALRMSSSAHHQQPEPLVLHLTVKAERVFAWSNLDQVPCNRPYAARIMSSEPISASAVRYICGLRGLDEWGMQVRCAMYGVPGPITG